MTEASFGIGGLAFARVLLLEHPSSLAHDPAELLPGHPEAPGRIAAIDAALAAADWLGAERLEAPAATRGELEGVHSSELVDGIERLARAGGGVIDADTAVGRDSWEAALHACGGACELVRALTAGRAAAGFALLRPPGHHAERSRAMGFCLFNNVAVAAQLALAEHGVSRVLILDWDVHHGNGTAEIFRTRNDVLYASIHRAPFYPGSGQLEDAGSGEGLGYTINLPVGAGTDGEVWRSLLEHVVIPAASRFAPELVLISAGFDAHVADPLGGCRLEADDFAQMACQVRALGERLHAPVGAVLEGGYDPRALGESVLATIRALGGKGDPGADRSGPALHTPRGRPGRPLLGAVGATLTVGRRSLRSERLRNTLWRAVGARWASEMQGSQRVGMRARMQRRCGVAACAMVVIATVPVTTASAAAAAPNARGVSAWGRNDFGQLGAGTDIGPDRCEDVASCSATPVPTRTHLRGVQSVAAGAAFGLALERSGTVAAWGENTHGQLADGNTLESDVPVTVSGLDHVTFIAAAGSLALAVLGDGTVRAWGDGSSWQLGNNTNTDSAEPVAVTGLSGVRSVAAGAGFGLALLENGTVMSWGSNTSGSSASARANPNSPTAQCQSRSAD